MIKDYASLFFAALAKSEVLRCFFMTHATSGYCIYDPELERLYMDSVLQFRLGLDYQPHHDASDFLPHYDREVLFQKLAKKEAVPRLEFEGLENLLFCEAKLIPFEDEESNSLTLLALSDVKGPAGLQASNPFNEYHIKMDLQGNYTYYNRTYREKLVPQGESRLGQSTLLDVLTEKGREKSIQAIQGATKEIGSIHRISLVKKPREGSKLYTDWLVLAAQNLKGELAGYYCFGKDSTELSLAQKRGLKLSAINKLAFVKARAKMAGLSFQLFFDETGDIDLHLVNGPDEDFPLLTKIKDQVKQPSRLLDLIDSRDQSYVLGSVLYSHKNQAEFDQSFRVSENGKTYWFRLKANLETQEELGPTWHGVLQDITEKVLLKERETMLIQVAKQISDAILVLDNNRSEKWYNQTFADRFIQKGREVSLGSFLNYLECEKDYQVDLNRFLDELKLKRTVRVIVPLLDKEQNSFWAELKHRPMWNSNGEYIFSVIIIRDINELVIKQQELQTLLNLSSEQSERLRSYTSIVSHNIRSHSANLLGLTQAIDNCDTPEEKEEYWSHLRDTSHKLEETIADLNKILSISSNLNLSKEAIPLKPLLKQILADLKLDLEEKKADYEIDIEEEAAEISAVPSYLRNILSHLIANSIRYASPKRSLKLTIKSTKEDSYHVLSVCDNGLGIDLKQNGKRIFRLYQTFHKHNEARGLGLHLIKQQIKAMGGDIKVESELDQGTCFYLYFRR